MKWHGQKAFSCKIICWAAEISLIIRILSASLQDTSITERAPIVASGRTSDKYKCVSGSKSNKINQFNDSCIQFLLQLFRRSDGAYLITELPIFWGFVYHTIAKFYQLQFGMSRVMVHCRTGIFVTSRIFLPVKIFCMPRKGMGR